MPNLPAVTTLLQWGWGVVLLLLGIYKKEVQDYSKGLFTRWHGRLFPPEAALRVTDAQLKTILGSGLEGLETLLLLLLKEYQADRATVTEYCDGITSATCLVEVRVADMKSVRPTMQAMPLPPEVREEILRVHHAPNRARYVPDARMMDVAQLRTVLLNSGVWSAYYQSLPTTEGECRAMLSISWHQAHDLTAVQLDALRLSGAACATVLQLMAALKPPPKA